MEQRARRVGLAAVTCALVLRLFSWGLPGRLLVWLMEGEGLAFLTYLETGRDIRDTTLLPAFSPNFVESPPAAATVPSLPDYADDPLPEIYYACNQEPDLQSLLAQPLTWELQSREPKVLILHTHATESYTPAGEGYRESASYRTLDEGYNLLSLGDRVAELLEQAGIATLHDRTLHDYPSYTGSYTRARETIRGYLEENSSLSLILDLHRDAVEVSYGQLRTKARVDGEDCAQLMLVVGTNYDTWQENLSLALKVHAQLERQASGLTRPLQLRSQRFNQDLSPGALLVEIGAAGNTHAQAMTAAEQLAEAIIALSHGTGGVDSG